MLTQVHMEQPVLVVFYVSIVNEPGACPSKIRPGRVLWNDSPDRQLRFLHIQHRTAAG
ncbi:MAG: hypothetical protein RJA81_204 [Planctomycetota bacterium]